MKLFKKLKFPNSSYLSRYGLYLPSYYSLKSKQIDYILDKISQNSLKKETLGGCLIKKVNQTVIVSKE